MVLYLDSMDTSGVLVSGETITALGLPPAGGPPMGGGKNRLNNGRKVKGKMNNKLNRKGEGIRIGTYNVNGVNDVCKRRELIEWFNESGMEVLGVQETHLVGEGVDGRNSEWEGLNGWACWSGRNEGEGGRKRMGVAIIMSEEMRENVIDYACVSARICWVICKVGVRKIAFVCAYAPVNEESMRGKKEMEDFWMDLNECIESLQKRGKVVVVGDMNAKVGCEERERVVGKYGVDGVNENGEHLVGMCAERGLFLANTFFQHKDIHKYTWRRGEGSVWEQKSLIDFIVIDEGMREWVRDARVVRGAIDISDHHPVVADIQMCMKWKKRDMRREYEERVDWQKLKDEGVRVRYVQELEKLNRLLGEKEYGSDVDELWKESYEGILKCVESVCGKKKVSVGSNRKRGDAWWCEEVREGVKRKREAWKKTLQRNVPQEERERRKRDYREVKNEVKKLVLERKKLKDEELGSKLSKDFVENRKLYHKEIKNLRGAKRNDCSKIKDEDGRVLKGKEEILKRWKEYFSDLMTQDGGGEALITCWGMVGGAGRVGEQGVVTRKEIRKAVKKLKLGKAPGSDGIRAEMVKYGGDVMIDILLKICKMAWEVGRVPGDWVLAVIVPLYKGKGCRDVCKSYRGISLLSIPGKVYGRVIIERVRERTRNLIGEEQGGFMEGRGCTDQIFTVKTIVERYIGKRRKLYAAFMDLEKAYDRVDRKALWDVMKIYGVGGKLLRAVQAFYENSRACVKVDGECSESFGINVGVRQGCVMSPWLFNIYMDGVMKEFRMRTAGKGAKMFKNGRMWTVPACLYADDAVLFAESEQELQRMVTEFDRVCERRKLRVNVGKSKVMVFERRDYDTIDFGRGYRVRVIDEQKCNVGLKGEQLEEVKEFKYLGSVLSKDGGMEGEIRERTLQGRRAIGELGTVVKGRSMSTEVKKNLRNSIVLPTLTYGSELWKWNAAEQAKIKAVEMQYLRGAMGRTRMDGVRNMEVYEYFGMNENAVGMDCGVVEWVKRSSLRWYGHVRRMSEERMAKRVFESYVSGENGRGRPPITWEGKVEGYIRERVTGGVRGLEVAKEICLDRNLWKTFCHGHPPSWELPRGARRRR